MQEIRRFGWQEEEACPRGEARLQEGDPFKGFAETPPPAAEAGPSPRDKAVAFIVPEAVLPTDDDEDDDFRRRGRRFGKQLLQSLLGSLGFGRVLAPICR
jgi:hypothetical protein